MPSTAGTVAEYLEGLPSDRRDALSAVRNAILARLPEGYEETMLYGAISYVVPHRLYPAGYHCDPKKPLSFLSLAAQKSHLAIYLMCAYEGTETRRKFEEAYRATGKKLDMGAACIRFKKLDDLALDVVVDTIASIPWDRYVASCEAALTASKTKAPAKS